MSYQPKAIIFDAFGTLVKIGESRSPYRQLMKWLRESGRKPSMYDAKIIMSYALNIEQLALHFGHTIPIQLLNEINDDLQFELNTIDLYEDTLPTLQKLKDCGFTIALCSNLAMPYGEKLKILLPNIFDALFLSYEVGYIKPEQEIYEAIRDHFSCEMSEMLFIGDHPILDVKMPISLGMSARLIERNRSQSLLDVLKNLPKIPYE
jgi:HAD superfamily hydrolase (TIGR01549 family)